MVLPRILTSLVLIPVVLTVVWYGTLPYFLFVFGVCMICLWEYSLMANEGGYPNQLGVTLFCGGLMLLSLYLDGATWGGPIHRAPGPHLILILSCFLIFLREFFRKDKGHSFLRSTTTLTGIVLCALCLGHLFLLRDLRMVAGEGFVLVGRELVYFLIFIIWSVDTGAWCVGKLLGRTPMAKKISPKKSWEGALGGTLLACGMGWFLQGIFLRDKMGGNEALLYAFMIALVAQVSDLIESLMKRSFGVKNSSELLPGHGGLLDRFDSFIFSAPFFYYILLATGRFH